MTPTMPDDLDALLRGGITALAQAQDLPAAPLLGLVPEMLAARLSLDQAAHRLGVAVQGLADLAARLSGTAGVRAEAWSLIVSGDPDAAVARLREARIALRAAPAATASDEATLLRDLAGIATLRDRPEEAAALHRGAARLLNDDPAAAWDAWMAAARMLHEAGKATGGVALLLQARDTLETEALPRAPRAARPLAWAMTQDAIGQACTDIARRRGEDGMTDRAIAAFTAALEERTRARAPLSWARTQHNLGDALMLRAAGDDAALRGAILAYGLALEERTATAVPEDCALSQSGLGNALALLQTRGNEIDPSRALDAWEAAEEAGYGRAGLKGDRAGALARLFAHADVAGLRRAAIAHRAALAACPRDVVPLAWGQAQHDLADVLRRLGDAGDQAAPRQAVAACEAALAVRARDRVPLDWARTQTVRAQALMTLGERGDDDALHRATECLEAALAACPRAEAPDVWAWIQACLGDALALRGEQGDDAALHRAAAAFEAVLAERRQEDDPLAWATTLGHLGNVLHNLGRRGDEAALHRAVAAHEAALRVQPADRVPVNAGITLNNLGIVLRTLGGRGDGAALQRAIEAFELALELFQVCGATAHVATVTQNLERARAMLPRG